MEMEDDTSRQSSADVLATPAAKRTMRLDDTQVVEALDGMDSFNTSSTELLSDGSVELMGQVTTS